MQRYYKLSYSMPQQIDKFWKLKITYNEEDGTNHHSLHLHVQVHGDWNIIQLLTGDEGNIWYAGPEDKMLPEAEGRGQHFVWRSNISYVARIPSQ